MINNIFRKEELQITINPVFLERINRWLIKYLPYLIGITLTLISILSYRSYLQNGLSLAYNDARSHLDIGRRVVEGLKPGLAQLGSVWLPLNHMLMIPLIWNDWAWHTGFAGTFWSMLSFVGTGLVISKYLAKLNVGILGQLIGVAVFVANLNILYLQSTAMTELLLIFTMTIGSYYLLLWHQTNRIYELVKSAFWIMLATLVRYDGWFLLGWGGLLVMITTYLSASGIAFKESFKKIEGNTILFGTLAAIGVFGWFAWNQLIFHDALYFALGPFSAHAQQEVMADAGVLPTKYNLWLSLKVYAYALLYSSYTYPVILAAGGAIILWFDRRLSRQSRIATTALFAPLVFNILALFLGFSVIFVQGISGDTWFNVRYGVMLAPTIAICIGYLVHRLVKFRPLIVGSLVFVLLFAFTNQDAASIDDARVGSSQKNVSEVSGYLSAHAGHETGFILVSAASHDAIIFSSGLPMKRFIHEGTGKYWDNALLYPDQWARWIVMRTHDQADLVWHGVSQSEGFARYNRVASYPFADVYELKPEYIPMLNTEANIQNNK